MKKLKASTDYGSRFILYLATTPDGKMRTSREAAKDLNIPRDYLVQLASRMHRAGLIEAKVGVSGGYRLAKPASEITLNNLLNVYEEYGDKTRKLADETSHEDVAKVMDLQRGALMCLEAFLGGITVQDLIDADGDGDALQAIIADRLVEVGRELQNC